MQKRIFQYFDGTEMVWADPQAIERKWYKACERADISTILSQFYGPEFTHNVIDGVACDEDGNPLPGITDDMLRYASKLRDQATAELVPILYETFGLSPIDKKTGEGTTEAEIINAFILFQNFIYEVKKNTETSPNLPQSTLEPDSESPILPPIPNSTNTNESADSDGTRNEP